MDRLQIKVNRNDYDPIHITADDRESKGNVITSLSEIENVAISIQRLPLGDYRISNRVIIERKTLKDFAISIADRIRWLVSEEVNP